MGNPLGSATERRSRASPLRGEAREQAVLNAATELVAQLGYERVTMDAIATTAHVSKATMYRRWPGKAEIIAEALRRHAALDASSIVDTGSLRGDLIAAVQGIWRMITGQDSPSLLGLLEALRADSTLRNLIHAQIERRSHEAGVLVAHRARVRGELTAQVEPQFVFDVAVAQLLMRALMIDEGPDVPFWNELVDKLLLPLLTQRFDSTP